MSKHVKVEQQLDGTWTVYTSPGAVAWAIGADFPDEASAQRVADAIDREAIGFAGSPRQRRPEWCPVCHTDHVNPGSRTDAGKLVRQCPQIPVDDPRNVFANYPGER